VTPTATPSPTPNRVLAIDAGKTSGGLINGWQQDIHGANGQTYATTAAQDISTVVNPAPQEIYKSERYGLASYYLNNLTPGATYIVRLHFSEIYFTNSGQRIFDVFINGMLVADDLDVFAASGGANKAYIVERTATANNSGQIVVSFAASIDNPSISGIEVLSPAGTPLQSEVNKLMNSDYLINAKNNHLFIFERFNALFKSN
jgi:hypothetical protein